MNEETKKPFIKKLLSNPFALGGIAVAIVAILVGGIIYWNFLQSRVYTDKASVGAQVIALAPHAAGTLKKTFVNEGDLVKANTVVAQVDNELIKTTEDSKVVSVNKNIGKIVSPSEAVVSVIRPSDLRVVGALEEDKGLSLVEVGQRVIFTVDAFGSKEYEGVIDEISPTVRQGDIVFNISDKRQAQEFNVMARFNVDKYSELKNGMSAKMWIYKK